jgi:hypothetical protein
MQDTAAGLLAQDEDTTAGQTGQMVASVGNGSRHILWDPVNFTCQGAPTRSTRLLLGRPPTASGQPTAWTTWSSHTDKLSFSTEIGHFDPKDGGDDDANCFGGPRIRVASSSETGTATSTASPTKPRAEWIVELPDAVIPLVSENRCHRSCR